ncbi:alanine--tRNA ligase [Lachnospiraceae bacterium oral taxon 096]|nr:alanine--tRNA ligase [Lachnospiraceae bacterium oral taxon 096]
MTKKYGLNEIRKMFLDYFESQGHLVLKSFSLVPHNDNSLLLINAGMAPLKPYFTGQEIPPRRRVATCQKCIRTGDIENVGKTARHGTFFEMLGNFSFGDYFKHEAIHWTWEFLTKIIGLDPNRLYPTVFEEDDEAFEIWTKEIGLAPERIHRFDKSENFWEHGSGPCGPCSEVYYDRGEKYGKDEYVGSEGDRFMEVWNNVFTQFENDGQGHYTELKNKNIDTGMGLERLAVVVQDVDSIFEVDTIKALLDEVAGIAGTKYKEDEKKDVSLRLITDHIRSCTFMISDGIMPSNEGRGYVLRRLLRRAARHGRMLGIEGEFLAKLAQTVIELSKDGYPELEEKKEMILKVLTEEESKFDKTIDQGLAILSEMEEKMARDGVKVMSGEDAFKLYDTYGFPIDLTKEIMEEKGFSIDEEGFVAAMENQRETARKARKTTNYMGADVTVYQSLDPALTTVFTGYDSLKTEGKIMALTTDTEVVEALTDGQEGTIVTDKSPFYATMGGQNADVGVIFTDDAEFVVEDTIKLPGDKIGHIGHVTKGMFTMSDVVEMEVDAKNRENTAKNHSCTHLLHKALREILGNHVEQAGSLVDAHRLRFDFTHFQSLTGEEIRMVEDLVNQEIKAALPVVTEVMDVESAKKSGAMALFGEKYHGDVRVVSMGDFSKELCGGTHVKNTSEIGAFKIISESGIAAGVRRIEALTGDALNDYYRGLEEKLQTLAKQLKTNVSELGDRIDNLLEEVKALKSENDQLKSKLANEAMGNAAENIVDVKGVKLLAMKVEGVEMNELRNLGDQLKKDTDDGVVVLASQVEGKVNLMVMAGESAVKKGAHAGNIVKAIAGFVGGGGGGRPNMAQAGGKKPEGIDEALLAAKTTLDQQL